MLLHQFNRLVVDVSAVLYGIDAGEHGEPDAVAAMGVGRDLAPQAMRLGDDGLHLFERVLRRLRVVAHREDAAGRADFDHVGAVLDHLARLPHHGRHAVGDAFVE